VTKEDPIVVLIARKNMEISGRYDKQDSERNHFTPKQLRRMEKQRNKWRKRLRGV
jgi:hypothetical protein